MIEAVIIFAGALPVAFLTAVYIMNGITEKR